MTGRCVLAHDPDCASVTDSVNRVGAAPTCVQTDLSTTATLHRSPHDARPRCDSAVCAKCGEARMKAVEGRLDRTP